MDKPNARELLKETSKALELYTGPYVGPGTSMRDMRELKTKIDAYLAAPSESATEIVRKIRDAKLGWRGAPSFSRGEYHIDYTITDSDAAALIEGLQRRVPRKMLLKLLREYWPMGDEGQYDEVIRKLSDDFGVVIE